MYVLIGKEKCNRCDIFEKSIIMSYEEEDTCHMRRRIHVI